MNCASMRSRLLAVAKKMYKYGLVTQTAGNASARDPETGLLLITPSAVSYEEMTVEDIVVCRPDRYVVEGRWRPSSELPMHSAVLNGRYDIGGVVHTHSPYALAMAALGQPIPPICLEVLQSGGPIAVAPWAIPGSPELGMAALQTLSGSSRAVLLQNHGLLATGATIEEALSVAIKAEEAARTYWLARSIGEPVVLREDQIEATRTYREAQQAAAEAASGNGR